MQKLDEVYRVSEKEELEKMRQLGKSPKEVLRRQQQMDSEDLDQVTREELLRDDDKIVLIKKGKGFERMEIDQQVKDAPDPRIHGAKIVFDSRLDEFSGLTKREDRLAEMARENPVYPKLTLKDKKEALFGKSEEVKEEEEEFARDTIRSTFKKRNDAEADEGAIEIEEERQRKVQEALINFKRVLVESGVPVGFCDYLLLQYNAHLSDPRISEKEVEGFLEYLKIHVQNIKFSPSQANPTLTKPSPSDPREYTLEELHNASKTYDTLTQVRKTIPKSHKNLQNYLVFTIEKTAADFTQKLTSACSKLYETDRYFKGINRLEQSFTDYISRPHEHRTVQG